MRKIKRYKLTLVLLMGLTIFETKPTLLILATILVHMFQRLQTLGEILHVHLGFKHVEVMITEVVRTEDVEASALLHYLDHLRRTQILNRRRKYTG